ncbi:MULTISPECIES: class I SAM-dependent methyltransferase [Vibrio]|uniref:class I SAM-dependent methyltransferase n=1 Tax=Vibrio TaxID=662 RepID=UPI002075278A|nr:MULTISPECIES: DUF4942 domain-containing protein [Vibrio]USD35635.1 DUF4942 domain-containing protein [Vibrio sp. SCSIO 43186]USD72759.1 DUF4942 domain-containing protein [Vibrio sp. SCSIO 43139]USD98964.1 hypothetical protein CTT30_23100 [Vibrio coralliilyticus]
MSTNAMVKLLKSEQADFEYYPTTPEMLQAIRDDLWKIHCPYNREDDYLSCSVLDCGAGDGSALATLTKGKKYAIEKSKPLLNAMHKDVFVVGTDFTQNTLIDKKVDVVFSNPPYSTYAQWCEKIITEANAEVIYLVIPQRWVNNESISLALESRQAQTTVIYSGNFLNADRQARAFIDIVKVDLAYKRRSTHYSPTLKVEPFSLWFSKHFKVSANKSKRSEWQKQKQDLANAQQNVSNSQQLIKDEGLVKTLETLYFRDMEELMNTYLKLNELDADLLNELDVSIESVQGALELKINSLKDFYWKELFNNLGVITDKLATKSRERMLETLTKHTHVDFNAENAHAIVIWSIKNANEYFDSQLVELVEYMTEKANVQLYKSNANTFGDEQWRYCRKPDGLDRYKLDYRVVVTRTGGIQVTEWAHERTDHNLTASCANFFSDLLTVAANLGFDTSITDAAKAREWQSNKKQEFKYYNHTLGREVVLFEAKAFKNGNAHVKFNQDFIMRLNVEFGRLRGWVKNTEQACNELNITPEQAATCFKANLQLTNNSVPLLLAA